MAAEWMDQAVKDAKSPDWVALVREVFPEVSEDDAGYILWNHTGFPSFWNIPEDGATPEECCRKQLEAARALWEHCDGETEE